MEIMFAADYWCSSSSRNKSLCPVWAGRPRTGGVNWRTPSTNIIIIIIIRQASTCLTPPTPFLYTWELQLLSCVHSKSMWTRQHCIEALSVRIVTAASPNWAHPLSAVLFYFYGAVWVLLSLCLSFIGCFLCFTLWNILLTQIFGFVLSCRDLTLMSQMISYWFFFLVISAAVVQKSVSVGFMGNVLVSGCLYIRVNISWFIQ